MFQGAFAFYSGFLLNLGGCVVLLFVDCLYKWCEMYVAIGHEVRLSACYVHFAPLVTPNAVQQDHTTSQTEQTL